MSLIALLTASSLARLKPNLTVLMTFWACRPLLAKSANLRDSAFSGQILPDVQVFLNFVSLTSPYKLTQTVLVVYGYIQIRTPRFQPHPSLFLLFCQGFRTFACHVLCGFDFLIFLPYLLRYVATAFLLPGFRLCVPVCGEIKA